MESESFGTRVEAGTPVSTEIKVREKAGVGGVLIPVTRYIQHLAR